MRISAMLRNLLVISDFVSGGAQLNTNEHDLCTPFSVYAFGRLEPERGSVTRSELRQPRMRWIFS